jgi:SpoVK/Ycf46/Vps4 family AAA+-type ATPase
MSANPVDVHRATDAVLVQLDLLAETHKNLLFVATSNFPQAIDEAFTSRCDLVLEIPPPNLQGCEQILASCLKGMGEKFNVIAKLQQTAGFDALVQEVHGLDGRTIRKVVASALTLRKQVAIDPNELSMPDLLKAAKAAKAVRSKRNKK